LLWLVPLDRHVPLFLQVDSLSFHLVQILPVRSTVEVHMIKMSSRRLEGFAIISLRDKESTELGLGELRVVCEATMGEDSNQWLWKCQNK
jgi:hypothetical protein